MIGYQYQRTPRSLVKVIAGGCRGCRCRGCLGGAGDTSGLGGEQQMPAEAHGLFRKTFALDEVPERAGPASRRLALFSM